MRNLKNREKQPKNSIIFDEICDFWLVNYKKYDSFLYWNDFIDWNKYNVINSKKFIDINFLKLIYNNEKIPYHQTYCNNSINVLNNINFNENYDFIKITKNVKEEFLNEKKLPFHIESNLYSKKIQFFYLQFVLKKIFYIKNKIKLNIDFILKFLRFSIFAGCFFYVDDNIFNRDDLIKIIKTIGGEICDDYKNNFITHFVTEKIEEDVKKF